MDFLCGLMEGCMGSKYGVDGGRKWPLMAASVLEFQELPKIKDQETLASQSSDTKSDVFKPYD